MTSSAFCRRHLSSIARQRLRTIEAADNQVPAKDLSLQEFIPRATPRWQSPRHLEPLTDVFERIEAGERQYVLASVPPQHGKSQTICHGVSRLTARRPWLRNAYASYGAALASEGSYVVKKVARAVGVQLEHGSRSRARWKTTAGGGLIATGIGGDFTGRPVDGILVVDDPHKNRQEAESLLLRQRVYDWFTSTAMPRVHPSASVIIVHTRWHEDDLIGRLSKELAPDGRPWRVINLPAINAAGEALWPEGRPLQFLLAAKSRGEYDWLSLYMGTPRSKAGKVFQDARMFRTAPPRYRVAVGVDLAYSEKTHADWSVAVVMLADDDYYYVVDVVRRQVQAPEFAGELKQLLQRHSARGRFYGSTTESGNASLMTALGAPVDWVLASADKFVRAQPVAAAWNAGQVLVRAGAPWAQDFISEVVGFTGLRDRHDDQVDALAAAYDALVLTRPSKKPTKQPSAESGMRMPSDRGF